MMTMLDYINAIPEYIEEHRDRGDYQKLHEDYLKENRKSVTVVASGSSNNTARCALYCLKELLDKEVNVYTPYTFVNYEKADPESFYVVISQSGKSRNTLEVVDRLKKEGIITHFITDNKEIKNDKLLKVYQLEVGNEEIPFVTKGMSATVYFLMRFAGAEFSEGFTDGFRAYQKKAEECYTENKEMLDQIKRIHIIGSGSYQAVASEGALKCCETMQIAASGYETEEFLHGGNFELLRDHLIIAIDSEKDHQRVRQLEQSHHVLCDRFIKIETVENFNKHEAVILCLAFFQTLAYLMNVARGNPVPTMKDRYLEFEGLLKAKTVNYYQ